MADWLIMTAKVEKASPPELCAVPDCGEPRQPMFLGWHGNNVISSAYCERHGPQMKIQHCSECGHPRSSRIVWPDGVPPAGVVNGKVGTLNA